MSGVRRSTTSRVIASGLLLGALLGPASPAALGAAAPAPRAAADQSAGSFLAEPDDPPLRRPDHTCGPPTARPLPDSRASVRLRRDAPTLRGPVGRVVPCGSLTSASSPWVVVNKRRPLAPLTYVPSALVVPDVRNPQGVRMREEAAAAVVSMFHAAEADGAGAMSIASGYRSFARQASLHRHRVATHGRAYADAWIARPGHSEHQTGLALDVAPVGARNCSGIDCLASTRQGRWLRTHAWRYGFVVRYESGSTAVTGFNAEPWHLRYIGTRVAADYHAGGWHTLEQYFGLPAAPTY